MEKKGQPMVEFEHGGATPPDVSVIIPVLNEIEGLDRCYKEVGASLERAGLPFEIVFVDDGSTDGSDRKMRAFAERDRRVTFVKLLYNVGQQRAMYIAFAHCRGRVVITYDSDLQFHPDCLPALARKVMEGYDIVGGIRVGRQDPLFLNRVPSAFGKFLINRALQMRQEDFGGVKAYSRRLVDIMRRQQSPFIIIPAMAYNLSRNTAEIEVRHEPRKAGVSKWSVFSRMELYLDLYTLYARRPFEWMMVSGVLSLLAGLLLGAGILWYRLFVSTHFSGLIIFFDIFLVVTGAFFFSLSFIGKFVVRILRGRGVDPELVVSEVISDGRSNSSHG